MRVLLFIFFLSLGILMVVNQLFTESQGRDLIVFTQRLNNNASIAFLKFFTNSVSLVSLGIPVLILLMSELKKNKSNRKKVLVVLICIAFAGLVSTAVKNTVKKPRPFTIDNRIEKLSGGGSYSFPSGHTTEAVSAAVIMIITFRYWYVCLLYISWALLIMYSRMALGVHDIFDLLGGIVIGTGGTLTVLLIESKLFPKKIS